MQRTTESIFDVHVTIEIDVQKLGSIVRQIKNSQYNQFLY